MTLNPTCRGRVAGHSLLNNVFVTRKEQSKDQFNKKRLSDNKVHGLQAKNKIKKSFYLDRQVIVERTPFFFFLLVKCGKNSSMTLNPTFFSCILPFYVISEYRRKSVTVRGGNWIRLGRAVGANRFITGGLSIFYEPEAEPGC